MKHIWIAALCLTLMACQGNTQDKVSLKSQKDSVSYSIGMNIGRNLQAQFVDADPMIIGHGIKDILDSSKTLLTDDQAQTVMMAFQQRMSAKRETEMKEQGEKNEKAGSVFLAENKSKPGVVTLPDGLQYKIEKTGTGKKPYDTSLVSVNYRGTLIDGKEFDSSFKRGQPAQFHLNQVIKGWSEALKLMPVGSKWTLYIPPALGYGEHGMGSVIPPNSTLIFEVELLSID